LVLVQQYQKSIGIANILESTVNNPDSWLLQTMTTKPNVLC